MEPVGRIVDTFHDICNEIWRRPRAIKSHKSGIENTSGEIDQPEELSNAGNGSGHEDNEGANFDDEKHCKTLSGVSINSNERQSQSKNRASYFTGSKMYREQMEETIKNRRYKKPTKKLPKGQTSLPTNGTNFAEVLIEKMEQYN